MLGGGKGNGNGDGRGVENFLFDKAGFAKRGMRAKDEKVALNAPSSPSQPEAIGRYVYHTTSWRNLLSIRLVGLDPARGGRPGSGGSCDLCPDPQLKATSISNSAGRIAVAVNRGTIGTYLRQREDFADRQIIGYGGAPGVAAENSAVLLRFAIAARHQQFRNPNQRRKESTNWRKDPDDDRAYQMFGVIVPPREIEVLLPEGWVPLTNIDRGVLMAMLQPPPPNNQPLPNPWLVPQQPSPEDIQRGRDIIRERQMMAMGCRVEARRDFGGGGHDREPPTGFA
jgi:hypothetical protein